MTRFIAQLRNALRKVVYGETERKEPGILDLEIASRTATGGRLQRFRRRTTPISAPPVTGRLLRGPSSRLEKCDVLGVAW